MSELFKDKNGVDIVENSTIEYKGELYMAMDIPKDNIGWIAHPIGNTSVDHDINLEDIHEECEVK